MLRRVIEILVLMSLSVRMMTQAVVTMITMVPRKVMIMMMVTMMSRLAMIRSSFVCWLKAAGFTGVELKRRDLGRGDQVCGSLRVRAQPTSLLKASQENFAGADQGAEASSLLQEQLNLCSRSSSSGTNNMKKK